MKKPPGWYRLTASYVRKMVGGPLCGPEEWFVVIPDEFSGIDEVIFVVICRDYLVR